jgi:hypothetical protein
MKRSSDRYANQDADPDAGLNALIEAGIEAIAEIRNPTNLPDREVIAPRYDRLGRLMPLYRIWLNDGYTVLKHALTPAEACSLAVEEARGMIETSGMGRRMTSRERRLATTVDCWQQVNSSGVFNA